MDSAVELLALKEFKSLLLATKERLEANFDKSITTLSGGAIALSLVFLERLQELGTPAPDRSFGWVIGAWAAWAFAIISSVLSGTMSIEAYDDGLADCDHILNHRGDEESRTAALERLTVLSRSRKARWAGRLMAAAGPLFALGIVSLLVFVAMAFLG